MRLRLVHAAIVLTAVAASCSTEPTRPIDGLRLELELGTRAGSPGHPIGVKARVVNNGLTAVSYVIGCGAGPPIRIAFLGPGETEPFDPCRCPTPCVGPACPDLIASLERGQVVENVATFDGTRMNCDGNCSAVAGRYTVTATFQGNRFGARPITLTQTKTFDWSTR